MAKPYGFSRHPASVAASWPTRSGFRASSTRTATRSSARCAGAPPGRTSGPGATPCSRRPSGRRRTSCARRTRRPIARCSRPGTRPSASSTTSASTRRSQLPKRLDAAGDRARPPPRRVRARRSRPLAPGVRRRVPRGGRGAARRPGSAVGARPPLRPRMPARLARGDRRATRRTNGLPLHVHADEQPREIEECLAEHGCRPIELLARTGCLAERTTVVHATHADGAELDLARPAPAPTVCACPTTEADLGDGFLPAERMRDARHPDLHRLRLERADRPLRGAPRARGHRAPADGTARRVRDRRARTRSATSSGHARSGSTCGPEIEVDLGHRSLEGVRRDEVRAALISGCSADVVSARPAA